MQKILISGFLLFAAGGIAQPTGSTSVPIITIYDEAPDSSVYQGMQQIITANWPVSYLSPLALSYNPLRNRTVPLQFGEGQKGYILEGLTDLQFVLAQGRPGAKHFYQTGRVTVRYAPAVRMTFDNSSNLLPTNQKIGLQADKVIWNNYTKRRGINPKPEGWDLERINYWKQETKPLQMVYGTFTAMHYSNGQPEGVWYNNDPTFNRNDYITGDFSTNLLQASFTYSRFYKNLLSANLGFQYDGDWGGPFVFIPEQKNRYGRKRLTGFMQYNSFPTTPFFRKRRYIVRGSDGNNYRTNYKWEWKIRGEWEYILGNLGIYPGGANGRLYRFNYHLFAEGMPLRSRSLGYVLHYYRGRDYLNIRYDDPVWAIMFGISIKLKKFVNPRFDPDLHIEQTTELPRKIQRYQANHPIEK